MIYRNRLLQVLYIGMVIILGLLSRKYASLLPDWLAKYSGDVLWGLMVYLTIGCILPRLSIRNASFTAMIATTLVEISQLYHAPWIDAIRSNRLGGLVLGYGFLWSDILCYLMGIAIGVLIELIIKMRKDNLMIRFKKV